MSYKFQRVLVLLIIVYYALAQTSSKVYSLYKDDFSKLDCPSSKYCNALANSTVIGSKLEDPIACQTLRYTKILIELNDHNGTVIYYPYCVRVDEFSQIVLLNCMF